MKDGIEATVELRTLGRIPFFLPTIEAILSKAEEKQTISMSAFFTRRISLTFKDFILPRGHHDSLQLEVKGTGLFGIFRYQTKIELATDIDIYPKVLSKSSRASLLQKISPILSRKELSPIHEFHVRELRTYQDRDSLSGIDWKSSLKRGQWMIKEYEPEDTQPIGIYFFGTNSKYFEELLSLTYSLYQDLLLYQQAQLFLFGELNGTIKSVHTKEDFLFIQQTNETANLNQLWHEYALQTGKKFVIAPKNYSLPTQSKQRVDITLLTEDQLN